MEKQKRIFHWRCQQMILSSFVCPSKNKQHLSTVCRLAIYGGSPTADPSDGAET